MTLSYILAQHPSGPSGLFYWDEGTATSKVHTRERYVPVRDVCLFRCPRIVPVQIGPDGLLKRLDLDDRFFLFPSGKLWL
jgi:hypothetical protein